MGLNKKYSRPFWGAITASVTLIMLHSIWIYQTYQLEHKRLITELNEAFSLAYQKEQTYRIPVVDIFNPGEVSIQSCGTEEIIIVRKCLDADTIVYNNISGRSIEKFINRVFWDLRENIVPLNLFCLSDLFAGMLHDKKVPVFFIIERYNTESDAVQETTFIPEEPERVTRKDGNTLFLEISDTEAIRAILKMTPDIIFSKMAGTLICTTCLLIIALACILLLYRSVKQNRNVLKINDNTELTQNNSTFHIGKYNYNPFKNELEGFGEIIQLNKKENSILYALCMQRGNVVERNTLLEENWGSSGIIYSRSLDTYLATLRKYLKRDPDIQIVTLKGVGYKLVCNF